MAFFALFYHVVDRFVERRTPFRESHLAHAQGAAARGELALAGALADPADTALIVFRGSTPDVARAFAESDPYVRNGLVKRSSSYAVRSGGKPSRSPSAAAQRLAIGTSRW